MLLWLHQTRVLPRQRAATAARRGDGLGPQDLRLLQLQQARQEIEEQVLPLDGFPLPAQERPVVWCMVQAALREAEELIAGGTDSSAIGVPSGTGGG